MICAIGVAWRQS